MSFDRYDKQEELGRGGSGVVYRARDRRLGRDVALKVVHQVTDPDALLRFEREAEAIGRLRHRGIVGVHEFGLDPSGKPFLAMDLVAGRSLQAWIDQGGPFEPAEAARIAIGIARALEHAHAQGVLHRDLKPENVLLEALGAQPVLTDFGLARLQSRETRLTATGDLMGTPVFMSPEQANGDHDLVGVGSDVYGLGGVLYALLTGRPPIRGTTLVKILTAVLKEPPEPVRRLRSGVPPALAAVCERCLRKDPRDRYPSAGAAAEALEEALQAPRRPPSGLLAGAAIAGLVGVFGAIAVVGGESPSATPSAPPPPTVTPAPNVSPVTPGTRHTVVIQPGGLEGVDTHVRGDAQRVRMNYGGSRQLMVGWKPDARRRLLAHGETFIRFDLTRVPAGAVVEKATLRLVFYPSSMGRAPVVLHAVRPTRNVDGQNASQTPWVEGTSLSNLLIDGMVWQGVQQQAVKWARARPEFSRPRVHEQPKVEGEVPMTQVETPWTIEITPIVVGWVDGAFPNLGLRMAAVPLPAVRERRERYFASSDSPNRHQWPSLEVVYRGAAPKPAPKREQLWDEAQRAADRILAQLPDHGSEVECSEAELAAVTSAIHAAPFYGKPWFERGVRLVRARKPGHAYYAEAHTSLRVAGRVARPFPDRERLLLTRTLIALYSNDAGRIYHDQRMIETFLKTDQVREPEELRRLLNRARRRLQYQERDR